MKITVVSGEGRAEAEGEGGVNAQKEEAEGNCEQTEKVKTVEQHRNVRKRRASLTLGEKLEMSLILIFFF